MNNNPNMKDILSSLDKNAVNEAKKGNTEALTRNLSDQEREKINSYLSDKEALKKLLSSPEAAALIKMFSAGGKNG